MHESPYPTETFIVAFFVLNQSPEAQAARVNSGGRRQLWTLWMTHEGERFFGACEARGLPRRLLPPPFPCSLGLRRSPRDAARIRAALRLWVDRPLREYFHRLYLIKPSGTPFVAHQTGNQATPTSTDGGKEEVAEREAERRGETSGGELQEGKIKDNSKWSYWRVWGGGRHNQGTAR